MFGINFGGGLELLKPQCHKELSNYRVDTTQDAQGVVPIFCLERLSTKKRRAKRTKGGSSEVKYNSKQDLYQKCVQVPIQPFLNAPFLLLLLLGFHICISSSMKDLYEYDDILCSPSSVYVFMFCTFCLLPDTSQTKTHFQ